MSDQVVLSREDRAADRRERAEEFLKKLGERLDIDILYYANQSIDFDTDDYSDMYESIYDAIDNNGGFYIDVIYYHQAMEYLSEHDNSLKTSFLLAAEQGYELSSLNSETLASILKSENVREEFYSEKSEIEEFFDELQSEVDEEEEEEETV